VGTVLRQLLCGFLATSSLITLRTPSRASLPTATEMTSAISSRRHARRRCCVWFNLVRATRSLEPLHRTPTLDSAADERAHDHAQRDYFAHISPEGVDSATRSWRGLPGAALCENIASGYQHRSEVVQA